MGLVFAGVVFAGVVFAGVVFAGVVFAGVVFAGVVVAGVDVLVVDFDLVVGSGLSRGSTRPEWSLPRNRLPRGTGSVPRRGA